MTKKKYSEDWVMRDGAWRNGDWSIRYDRAIDRYVVECNGIHMGKYISYRGAEHAGEMGIKLLKQEVT